MPDWRNANDYRFPQDFPDYRWAWEFLRRNPEYRRDWESALSRFISKTGEFERVYDVRAFLESGGTLVGIGENVSEDPTHPSFYLPVDEADRWRLSSGLFNPATDKPEWLTFKPGFGTVHYLKKGYRFTARGPAYPIVEFNLHLPLKPQLEAISEPLERARKHLAIKPRRIMHYRSLWPHYLRLLDADLDERTPKQIADVLNRESSSGGIEDKKVWDQAPSRSADEISGRLPHDLPFPIGFFDRLKNPMVFGSLPHSKNPLLSDLWGRARIRLPASGNHRKMKSPGHEPGD